MNVKLIDDVIETIKLGDVVIAVSGLSPDNVYTKTETNNLLDNKSNTDHNHSLNNLTEKSYTSLTDKPSIPTLPIAISDVTDLGTSLSGKQETLQNTVNIKSINGISLLGGGNIVISGGGGTTDHSLLTNRDISDQHPINAITGLETALSNKADNSELPTKMSELEKDIDFDERYYTESEIDTSLALKENLLPSTPISPETKFLNGNKLWSEIIVGSGGYSANLYLSNIDSDVSGYKTLSYSPDAVETIKSVIVNNNEVLSANYLFPQQYGITLIDAGAWIANIYGLVSSNIGITQLRFVLFVRHIDNTETDLFSKDSVEINNETAELIRLQYSSGFYSVLATDRLGVRIFAKTTRNVNTTVSYYIGNGNATYITTPIRLRHNQLRDLNGDVNYQHLTSNQISDLHSHTNKTNLDNYDPTNFALSNHNHSGVYEPIINTKNTAFNKNFGTIADSVCAGNDARLSDARTPTAHEQAIGTIIGLQTALDNKMAKQILATNGSTLPTDLTSADIFRINATSNLSFGTLTIPSDRSVKQFEITNTSASDIIIAIPTTTAHRRETDTVTIPTNKMRTITVDYDGTTYNWYMSAELKNA